MVTTRGAGLALTLDPLALLRLLQLADSGFPTGAFAFSHGLEGMVAAGLVGGEAGIADLLALAVREGFAGVEGPAMCHAHRAALAEDAAALLTLDATAAALKPVLAFRSGSARVGRRLLESASPLLPAGERPAANALTAYHAAVTGGEAEGHYAVAFGAVMAAAGIAEDTALLTLGAGFAGNLAAAAVRLGVIGQNAAQRTLAALHPALLAACGRARALPVEEMGSFLPMADVAGLRQPTLPGRLFGS